MSPELQTPMVGAWTGGSSIRSATSALRRDVGPVPVQTGGEGAGELEIGGDAVEVRMASPLAEVVPSRPSTATPPLIRRGNGRAACTRTSRPPLHAGPDPNDAGWPTDSTARWSTRSGASPSPAPRRPPHPSRARRRGPARRPGGRAHRPRHRRRGATPRRPRPPPAGRTCRSPGGRVRSSPVAGGSQCLDLVTPQPVLESGHPCNSTTGGPSPRTSRTSSPTPLTS